MSLSVQFISLLAMMGTGVLAGAFMDMISTFVAGASKRSIIRKWAVVLEVVGWIFIGFGSFYILFLVRDGAWRMYDPLAQLSGMLLYASLFYVIFRFFGRVCLTIIIRPLWFLAHLCVSTLRQLLRIIFRIVFTLFRPFYKLYRKMVITISPSKE